MYIIKSRKEHILGKIFKTSDTFSKYEITSVHNMLREVTLKSSHNAQVFGVP